ncbi:MAG: ABC transporter permease [Clostridia bacterium]|nr:ABC transporter permease [Clostridia bacterium]
MNIYRTLAWYNLARNKKRTIATITGIIIAIALICFVTTFINCFQSSMIKIAKKTVGNYHVSIADVTKDEIFLLKERSTVDKIEKIGISQTIGAADYKTQNYSKQGIRIEGYDDISLNNRDIQLVKGKLPKNENEILISSYLVNNANEPLEVGTKITLDLQKVKLSIEKLDNKVEVKSLEPDGEERKEYTITGIIKQTNDELYSSNAYIAITKLDKVEHNRPYKITILLKNLKQLENYYNTLTNINNNFNISENTELLLWQGGSNNSNEKTQLELIGSITVLIIMGISIALIRNSFQISVSERIKEFGILLSIGTTSKQIKRMLLTEGLFYVLSSIPIGILLGTGAMFFGTRGINSIMRSDFNVEFSFSIFPIIISIILILVTIFISCIKPIKDAKKVPPIETIRQTNEITDCKEKIKISSLVQKKLCIEGIIAYKNVKRNKKKYKATTISICIIIMLLFIINNIVQYIAKQTNNFYPSNYNIDISPIYGDTSYSSQLEVYERIKQLENIEEYSMYAIFNGEIKDKLNKNIAISIIACEGKVFNQYLKRLDLRYEDIISGGILVTTRSNNIIKEDDNLAILVNEKQYEIPIIKKTNDDPWNAIQTLDISQITQSNNIKLILPIQAIKNIDFESNGFTFSEAVGMRINSSNSRKLENDISKFVSVGSTIVTNYEGQQEKNEKVIFTVNVFLYGMLIIISLIGIANIYNTIIASMNLRIREFTILKSIGMTRKQLNKMLYYEVFLYTTKAILFGVILSTIINFVLYLLLKNNNNDLTCSIPIGQIVISGILIYSIIRIITKVGWKKINQKP